MSELEIICEDEQLLVVNKPAGLATQAPRQFDSLEARVRVHLARGVEGEPYVGVPHRLDRCVSGVIVFAKKRKAAQRVSKQFELREVEKTYVALVSGSVQPESGEWRDYLRKVPDEPRVEVVSEGEENAKLAILQFNVLEQDEDRSRLKIQLETGRMHQIRIQCATRGYPVLGDKQYGSQVAFGPEIKHERERHIALQASELSFTHPKTRERITFSATPLV